MSALDSVRTDLGLNMEMDELSFYFGIGANSRYGSNNAVSGDFRAEISVDETYVFDGEFIGLEDNLYLKIGSLPALISNYLPSFGIIPEAISNVWLEMDVMEDVEDADNDRFLEKIMLTLEKHNVYTVEALGREGSLEGYLVSFDKDALVYAIKDILDVAEEFYGSNERTPREVEDVSDVLDMVGEIEVYVWIGARDGMIHKISTKNVIDSDSGDIHFSLEVLFSQFNKRFEISAPENFKRLEEVLLYPEGLDMF